MLQELSEKAFKVITMFLDATLRIDYVFNI